MDVTLELWRWTTCPQPQQVRDKTLFNLLCVLWIEPETARGHRPVRRTRFVLRQTVKRTHQKWRATTWSQLDGTAGRWPGQCNVRCAHTPTQSRGPDPANRKENSLDFISNRNAKRRPGEEWNSMHGYLRKHFVDSPAPAGRFVGRTRVGNHAHQRMEPYGLMCVIWAGRRHVWRIHVMRNTHDLASSPSSNDDAELWAVAAIPSHLRSTETTIWQYADLSA